MDHLVGEDLLDHIRMEYSEGLAEAVAGKKGYSRQENLFKIYGLAENPGGLYFRHLLALGGSVNPQALYPTKIEGMN